jgi:hypothetical protein
MRITGASLCMGACSGATLFIMPQVHRSVQVLCAILVGIASYALFSILFNIEERKSFLVFIRKSNESL